MKKQNNKPTVFELGKCYEANDNQRKHSFKIDIRRVEKGIIIKTSPKFESYIAVDSFIYHKPEECKEISIVEFLKAKENALKIIEEKFNKQLDKTIL